MDKKTFHITTFGCQMNERDSEEISSVFKDKGFVWEEDEQKADFVLYNTCTVRENANNRVWGRLGYLNTLKKQRPGLKIGLCGCMMQDNKVIEKIKESYPFVDLVFGTHNLHKFPELLEEAMSKKGTIIDIWENAGEVRERKIATPKFSFKSGVNIMYGCDNYCSYCIVPYVRGRERSREASDILDEIKKLTDNGVSEIMLLGQNVNSYGKNLENEISFSQLLNLVCEIDGVKRVRFMTSHPKDLSDALIETIAANDKICKHIHLPLQSGSSRILKLMNRKYSKEDYLKLCGKIHSAIPRLSLTTDIIVGYPGEEEEDFNETIDVVKKVGFQSAFTFIYSPRNGTPAAKQIQTASDYEIKTRFDKLLDVVKSISEEKAKEAVGTNQVVLVEKENLKDSSLMTGRIDNNMTVHFSGNKEMIGQYRNILITQSKGFYYIGELTD